MKYSKKDLELAFNLYNFNIPSTKSNYYVDIKNEKPMRQMFYYTFDLDFDSELDDSDIEKIKEYYNGYFDSKNAQELKQQHLIKLELFIALTNSPKCPYKIIGVSSYMNTQGQLSHVYHFMIKHDILAKTNQISI